MARVALCTSEQVLQTARFSTADEVGGSAVVTEAIDEADEEVYNDFGNPLKKSNFVLSSTQQRYEFRVDNKKVFRIDKVIIRDSNNNRIVYTAGSASESNLEYTKDLEFNTITFDSSTTGKYDGNRVEVHYTLNVFHILSRTKAALFLNDWTNVVNAEGVSTNIGLRLLQRIRRLESQIMPEIGVGSEDEIRYDPTLGETILQRRFWTYN